MVAQVQQVRGAAAATATATTLATSPLALTPTSTAPATPATTSTTTASSTTAATVLFPGSPRHAHAPQPIGLQVHARNKTAVLPAPRNSIPRNIPLSAPPPSPPVHMQVQCPF
jgi:hypothetical protein